MAFATRARFDWQLRTRTLRLGERTMVMAIVNVTPDSFSGDGLADSSVDDTVAVALDRLDGGADILDLGAESTRPGAEPLTSADEQARLLPVLEALMRERPFAVVSVDTYHAATARAAIAAGAQIVNDVSGLLWDEQMATVLTENRAGYVLMHTRGRPQEWRSQPDLKLSEVTPLVLGGLRERLDAALAAGIDEATILLDPGFGFGKRGSENLALLGGFARLAELGRPLLAGLSRKAFLGNVLAGLEYEGRSARGSLSMATSAANVMAIVAGAHVIRVHDVQEAREAIAVIDSVLSIQHSAGESAGT